MLRLSLACALLASATARPEAPDAPDAREAATGRELAQALSAERLGLAAGEAKLVMELRDRTGRVVSRGLRARIAVDGAARKMRLTFTEPADQRGVELLVDEAPGRAPLLYLWLPRAAELRRIASGGERFQGSDFALSDFADRDLGQATVAVAGEETIGGLATRRIDITGAPGALGEWTKVSAWITTPAAKDAGVPLRVQFFRGERLVRQLEVKKLQPAGADNDRLVPTLLEMSDLVRGTRTTLRVLERSADARFPAAIFAPEALGR